MLNNSHQGIGVSEVSQEKRPLMSLNRYSTSTSESITQPALGVHSNQEFQRHELVAPSNRATRNDNSVTGNRNAMGLPAPSPRGNYECGWTKHDKRYRKNVLADQTK